MPYCTNCGEELDYAQDQCHACGEPVETSEGINIPQWGVYVGVSGLIVGSLLYLAAPTATKFLAGIAILGVSIGVLHLDAKKLYRDGNRYELAVRSAWLYLVLIVLSSLPTLRSEFAVGIGVSPPFPGMVRRRLGIPLVILGVLVTAFIVWSRPRSGSG